MKKKIVSAFLVFVMALLCVASASAAGTGSIQVNFPNGYPIADAKITAYRVSDLEGKLDSAFATSGVDLTKYKGNSSTQASEVAALASTLQIFVNNNKVAETAVFTSNTLSGLETGVYLILQNSMVSGYYAMTATLVKVERDETTIVDPKIKTPTPGNTYANVRAIKVWDDNGDADKVRPASVTVVLVKDGVATDQKATLTASNGWMHTFAGLATGHTYTLQEITVPGYDSSYSTAVNGNSTTVTITNKHTPSNRPVNKQLTVQKVWQGGNNIPSEITVQLLNASTNAVVQEVKLNSTNSWKYTFGELDADTTYTVKELPVDGWTGTYTSVTGGFTITNTYTPPTTPPPTTPPTNGQPGNRELHVVKVWKDGTTYPSSITVQLFEQNSQKVLQQITISADTNWRGTFSGLDNNKSYTIKEVAVSGYLATYTYDSGTSTYTITNSHKIPQTSMLQWPIPVLTACGAGLIVMGVLMNRKRKERGEQA